MPDNPDTDLANDIEKLRRTVILITRFISDNILDPHSGFEGQFLGAGRNADSYQELLILLRRLTESLDLIGFPVQQMQQLDRQLKLEGIPPLSTLKTL